MSEGIRRGNRVSPIWFLLVGLLLLLVGAALLTDIFTSFREAAEADGREFTNQEVTVRVVGGYLCLALGALALQIWLISFAITVGLVETNRRLERLDHLVSLEWYAQQQQEASDAGSGQWRPTP